MRKKIILDANLSILFAVGLTDPSYIRKHNRLQQFDETDFFEISNLIAISDGLIFIPNTLTETSNLVRYVSEPISSEISATLSVIIERTEEVYIESQRATSRTEYLRLGISDSAILKLAENGAVILTVDLDLYVAASTSGLEAINYNHIREQRPDFK